MQLKDPTLFSEKVPVAGRWVGSDGRDTAAIHNPARGKIIGRAPNSALRKHGKQSLLP